MFINNYELTEMMENDIPKIIKSLETYLKSINNKICPQKEKFKICSSKSICKN